MPRIQPKADLGDADGARFAKLAHVTFEVLFEGKWRVQVLCAMRRGPVRLGQLGRLVPGASKKMLAQCLRRLEADGIVARHDLSNVILHVEYELHEDVRNSIGELLDHLAKWGSEYVGAERYQQQEANGDKPARKRRVPRPFRA